MNTSKIAAFRQWMIVSFTAFLVACGGGGGDGSGASSSTGTMSFSVTDAPGDYENVFVTITGVRVSQNGSDGAGDDQFEEMMLDEPLRIDLLTLQNGTFRELGDLTLPVGNYKQARLVLAETTASNPPFENAVVLKSNPANEIQLTTPSAQQSGLKVNIDLDVGEGQIVDLRIDFDANKSVVERGNSGQYNLKPVLRAVPVLATGVSGTVDLSSAGENTRISLQQEGELIVTTVPAEDGSFTAITGAAGTYDLILTSEGKATQVVTSIPVEEEAITNLNADTDNEFVLMDDGSNPTDAPTLSGTVSNDDNPESLRTTLTITQTLTNPSNPIVLSETPLTLTDSDNDPATDDDVTYAVTLSDLEVLVAPYTATGAFNFQSDGAGSAGIFTATVLADYEAPATDETLSLAVDVSAGNDSTQNFTF